MQEKQRLRTTPDDKFDSIPLNMKSLSTDEAIERVGGNHCFQCYVALILTSCFCITGMTSLGLPWLEKQPDPVECLQPDGSYVVCTWKEACQLGRDHFRYDMDKAIVNFRTDFKMECVDDRIIAFIGSAYFLGWMISSPIWLRLADVWGRRLLIHVSIIPHLILTAAFFLITPSNANWLIIFINVMIGLKESMTSIVAYVLLSEMVSSKYRAYYSAANNIYDGLQNILISVMFYFGRDWHYVSYYYLAVLVLLFFVLFLVPESPRYLLSKKKYERARAVYAKIARINKREMFTEPLEGEAEPEGSHQRHSISSDDSASARGYYTHHKVEGLKYGSMKAFFKAGCALWFPLSLLLIMWITVNIVFYGIQIGTKDFKGNMLATTSLSACADMIGYTLAGFGANYLGRKPSLFLGFTLAAIACLIYSLFHPATWAVYLSVALGKLGISFCFNVIYIVTAETYSTEYRGTVFGAANFFARGGGFLAPIVEQLLTGSFMFIFTVLSGIAAVLVFFLRETRDLRMPDSLDEYFQPKKVVKDRAASVEALGLPKDDS